MASLDPFHWIFEFPTAYSPTDDEAFDVVIGNPPHGSDLGDLQKSVLEDCYDLIEGSREVAKLFTERGWALTEGELSYVVPKPSTYNSNWEDFRAFCLDEMHRGVDLGKAFRNVDHEQVTIHLSRDAAGDDYLCGPLAAGAYHVDGAATVDRPFAAKLGTLPVSSVAEQEVAAGLSDVDYPTLGSIGADAGRGASTTNRISVDGAADSGGTDDPDRGADAPIAYNGKQVQRYFTRAAENRIETGALGGDARARRGAEGDGPEHRRAQAEPLRSHRPRVAVRPRRRLRLRDGDERRDPRGERPDLPGAVGSAEHAVRQLVRLLLHLQPGDPRHAPRLVLPRSPRPPDRTLGGRTGVARRPLRTARDHGHCRRARRTAGDCGVGRRTASG
ncbi:Eco57I restriction-modification methylase domain-containing protein [Halosimplex aquaticum]